MKVQLLLLLSLFFGAGAFAGGSQSLQPGKILDSVICTADATQSYALYIPSKGAAKALPVVYFFDPHGSGSLPVSRYKELAETYGFILVGSNNSKNGNDYSTTEMVWQRMLADTKSRLKLNAGRIYTCGFSGGAKCAGFVAIQHPEVKGIIVGGAGLPDGVSADNFEFSITAISGSGDMNMTELVAVTRELDKTKTRHRLLFFEGKHEWAPVTTMRIAFAGLQLDGMQKGLLPRDNAFINGYITASRGRVEQYSRTGRWIAAREECVQSMSFLDGLTDAVSWFRTKAAALAASPLFQKQEKVRQDLLVRENTMKQEYMSHFQQENQPYWTRVITDLQSKSHAGTAESAMYQRLLAYLSLAFYSISNHFISGNDNRNALYFVNLYKMADPGNSEAWYFSALLNARAQKAQATENDLQKAIQCGFRDMGRLRKQPEFQLIDLIRIQQKMTSLH